MGRIAATKHEGAGNDFVLMVDLDDRVQLSPAEVAAIADRHHGVGADGVITVLGPSGGGEVTMRLANQDGSPAEISGNGLRCVVHEAVRSGLVAAGEFSVMTGAGLRRVRCEEPEGDAAWTSAEMGAVTILELDEAARRAIVDVGNPHLAIVVDELGAIDAEAQGGALQSTRPGGINVEWISPDGRGGLDLVVFERGVGLTLACGSGSCAAAATAKALGLVGDAVEVRNPGGSLEVSLAEGHATLSGVVRHVADLLIPIERAE